MSSQSYMGGEKGSFALLEQLQKLSGVDVTMGAQSAEQAFKLCGAKKIALLTPYYPVIEHNAVSYFTVARLRGGPRRRVEVQEHHPRGLAEYDDLRTR